MVKKEVWKEKTQDFGSRLCDRSSVSYRRGCETTFFSKSSGSVKNWKRASHFLKAVDAFSREFEAWSKPKIGWKCARRRNLLHKMTAIVCQGGSYARQKVGKKLLHKMRFWSC